MACAILKEHGSLPIGKMGSLLHRAANNHTLPAKLKARYGGLKRFLQAHKGTFDLGSDHPYNPHVRLVCGISQPDSSPPATSTTTKPTKDAAPIQHAQTACVPQPTFDQLAMCGENNALALECEIAQGVLVRCCLVNFNGELVYDKHVKGAPTSKEAYLTTTGDGYTAVPLETLQQEVGEMVRCKYIVAHMLDKKLPFLNLSHDKRLVRDVAMYQPLCPCGPRPLSELLWDRLGIYFQAGANKAVEEARACLAVYKSVLRVWEASLGGGKEVEATITPPQHQYTLFGF